MNMKITTTEVVETECTSSKLIQTIETKFVRGTDEPGNPVRMVTQYWSVDGKLLAEKEENIAGTSDALHRCRQAKARAKICEKHLETLGYDVTSSSELPAHSSENEDSSR